MDREQGTFNFPGLQGVLFLLFCFDFACFVVFVALKGVLQS